MVEFLFSLTGILWLVGLALVVLGLGFLKIVIDGVNEVTQSLARIEDLLVEILEDPSRIRRSK